MTKVTREGDFVVFKIKAGREAQSFGRFLEQTADAIEVGKILPTTTISPVKAADNVRALAKQVHEVNA